MSAPAFLMLNAAGVVIAKLATFDDVIAFTNGWVVERYFRERDTGEVEAAPPLLKVRNLDGSELSREQASAFRLAVYAYNERLAAQPGGEA